VHEANWNESELKTYYIANLFATKPHVLAWEALGAMTKNNVIFGTEVFQGGDYEDYCVEGRGDILYCGH
jgi:hypothetical protein